MGSNASRRMNHSSEEDELSIADSEETDLPTVLAYLLRSGHIRLYSAGSHSSDEDSSSDKDPRSAAAPPVVESSPDTSAVLNNDIRQMVLLSSGRILSPQKQKWSQKATIVHMVHEREIGFHKRQQFSRGDCCVLNSRYLPNHFTKLKNYPQKVFCGSYSQCGDIFLSAAQDQCIRIFDTREEFRLLKCIQARDVGWSILDTAFSPDGNYIVYSSWSDCIHLCNVHGDYDIHESLPLNPGNHSFCIFSLKFSSDNREILGGANNGFLYVYNRENNSRTLKINAHDDDINAVAFADDSSNILLSGGDDGLCKVWDRRTLCEHDPEPIGIMAGHRDGITFIDSKMDGRYFISNSKDQCIKLWDMRAFSKKDGIEATKHSVSTQRWDYRWEQVPKQMARADNLQGDSSVMTYKGHHVLHTLIRCRFSPDFSTGQRYIYCGCATGGIIIYDLLTGKMVRNLKGHKQCVRDVSWHPFDNTMISSSWDCTLGRWSYQDPAAREMERSEEDITKSFKRRPPRQNSSHVTPTGQAGEQTLGPFSRLFD